MISEMTIRMLKMLIKPLIRRFLSELSPLGLAFLAGADFLLLLFIGCPIR